MAHGGILSQCRAWGRQTSTPRTTLMRNRNQAVCATWVQRVHLERIRCAQLLLTLFLSGVERGWERHLTLRPHAFPDAQVPARRRWEVGRLGSPHRQQHNARRQRWGLGRTYKS